MAANTSIEWTDASWSPIGGCSIKSTGCTNCFAQRIAGTRLAHHPLYAGTTSPSKAGPVFNGHLTVAPDDHPVWTWPMRWRGAKNPRRGKGARSMIFVGDMSDLAHEDRPDWVLDKVFAVAARCPQFDFQILTKRIDRLRRYLTDPHTPERVMAYAGVEVKLPLPNVWVGTSVERQQEADERITELRSTPAAVRFLSCEPLLSLVDLRIGARFAWMPPVDWVICGGESGRDARPMDLAWARDICYQCVVMGVPFFMKQAGAHPLYNGMWLRYSDRSGSDPTEWPTDLRVRLWPEYADV